MRAVTIAVVAFGVLLALPAASGAATFTVTKTADTADGACTAGNFVWRRPGSVHSAWSPDGCVVLANPDLERIIRTVEVRSTPVVIGSNRGELAASMIRMGPFFFSRRFFGKMLPRGPLSRTSVFCRCRVPASIYMRSSEVGL